MLLVVPAQHPSATAATATATGCWQSRVRLGTPTAFAPCERGRRRRCRGRRDAPTAAAMASLWRLHGKHVHALAVRAAEAGTSGRCSATTPAPATVVWGPSARAHACDTAAEGVARGSRHSPVSTTTQPLLRASRQGGRRWRGHLPPRALGNPAACRRGEACAAAVAPPLQRREGGGGGRGVVSFGHWGQRVGARAGPASSSGGGGSSSDGNTMSYDASAAQRAHASLRGWGGGSYLGLATSLGSAQSSFLQAGRDGAVGCCTSEGRPTAGVRNRQHGVCGLARHTPTSGTEVLGPSRSRLSREAGSQNSVAVRRDAESSSEMSKEFSTERG